MLSLMAVKTSEEMPLYLHTVTRILRVLRIAHQINGKPFHYGEFKKHLEDLRLTTGQEGPLTQRLDTLESFMPIEQRTAKSSAPVICYPQFVSSAIWVHEFLSQHKNQ